MITIKKNEKSKVFLIFHVCGLNHFLKSSGKTKRLRIKHKKVINEIPPKKKRGKCAISSCPKVGLNKTRKKKITAEKDALMTTLCNPFSINRNGLFRKEIIIFFIINLPNYISRITKTVRLFLERPYSVSLETLGLDAPNPLDVNLEASIPFSTRKLNTALALFSERI